RFDLEGVTHIVTGRKHRAQFTHLKLPIDPSDSAIILRNDTALPRARLAGKPVYALGRSDAIAEMERLSKDKLLLSHVLVEDPTRPLSLDASASGTARIVTDLPERVVVEVEAGTSAYLVLSDTFDPGWSATVDGNLAAIRPAYIAFRAVFVPRGN